MAEKILTYLWERRTTALGYLQIALGAVIAQGGISEGVMRWVVLANGILTAVLGHYNNSRIKALQAQVLEKEQQK